MSKMIDRLNVLGQSMDNHLYVQDTTSGYKFALEMCKALLFTVDYSQDTTRALSLFLRTVYRTIAKQARNKEIDPDIATGFESVRFSLAHSVLKLTEEEIEAELQEA